jgi:hypothetical protein
MLVPEMAALGLIRAANQYFWTGGPDETGQDELGSPTLVF